MPLVLERPARLMVMLPSGFIPGIRDGLVIKVSGSAFGNCRQGHPEDCKEPQAGSGWLWKGWGRKGEWEGRENTTSFENGGNTYFDHWSECSFLVNKCDGTSQMRHFLSQLPPVNILMEHWKALFWQFSTAQLLGFISICTAIVLWITKITALYRAEETQNINGLVRLLRRVHLEQTFL